MLKQIIGITFVFDFVQTQMLGTVGRLSEINGEAVLQTFVKGQLSMSECLYDIAFRRNLVETGFNHSRTIIGDTHTVAIYRERSTRKTIAYIIGNKSTLIEYKYEGQ